MLLQCPDCRGWFGSDEFCEHRCTEGPDGLGFDVKQFERDVRALME